LLILQLKTNYIELHISYFISYGLSKDIVQHIFVKEYSTLPDVLPKQLSEMSPSICTRPINTVGFLFGVLKRSNLSPKSNLQEIQEIQEGQGDSAEIQGMEK